jgi:iron complex outermembrane recepter protein
MFDRTQVATAVLFAFSGVLAAATTPAAYAQQETSASAPQRIEITGSNIKRTDAELAAPVQLISKQDIDQSGKSTVAEYLQTLTADSQGSVPFTYGRGFSGGTSAGISLRGLGANATLVLINGRRMASAVLADDAQRSYVDLNQIPMEAVDRIEVLKDGASSIYGSDAVAGVVNIVLKRNFTGTVAKLTFGMAQERDGKEPRVALTHGFGDLASDGYNVLLNAEFGKRDAIYYRDRAGRGSVGVSAIGQPRWGFDPNSNASQNIGRLGGNGTIPVGANGQRLNNATNASIVGNVRNPSTLDYYSRGDAAGVGFTQSFPGAQAFCLANANLPQNNPAGGCITDLRQAVNQVQPESETASFYGRLTKALGSDLEGFVELGLYSSKSGVDGLPGAPSAGYFLPDGSVVSQTATTLLGAAHPDNPYLGTAARLSYLPLFDTGVSGNDAKTRSTRVMAGFKGTLGSVWDIDAALSFSEVKLTDTLTKAMNWRVKNALLNPTAANVAAATAFSPAYAALPAGTLWRIGENAGLNSAAMYDSLLDDKQRRGYSRQYGIDAKASRELGTLGITSGGPVGLALGFEARHEANDLPFYDGLGDYSGLGFTRYGGKRDIVAAFAEVAAPLAKDLELTGALRIDHYSDAGRSVTPKLGAKWRPLSDLALRATFSRGFRAPSSTENSSSSIAGFSGTTIDDNARCAALTAAGLEPATVNANCRGIAPTFVQRGNPALDPERSQSATLGVVWDIARRTSLTADLWQIKRKGLPVIQDTQAAIDAGNLVRDPETALAPGDPGAILSASVLYVNAAQSLTRGLDIELKQRLDLGQGWGRLTAGLTWTHLFTQRVIDADGTVHDYAGTHGNCDVSNCMGSPKDRVSFAASWERGPLRLGANVNYRGSMSNKLEQADTECAQHLLSGADFPAGCRLGSFTTLDVSGVWKFSDKTEVFGSVANLLNKVPPADFLTYGAIGFNPLDYSGAIGRFFRVGVKHRF